MNTIKLDRRQLHLGLVVLAVSGLIGGALATWLMPGPAAWAQDAGQTIPDVVRAKAFEVVDDEGKTRATLAMANDGNAVLRIRATGGGQAALGVSNDMPSLMLSDPAGHLRGIFSVFAGGAGATITLFDETGDVHWKAP